MKVNKTYNIFAFIKKLNREVTTKEIKTRFKYYKRGTRSSALTRLYQRSMIQRVKRGVYRWTGIFFEHFISGLLYCSGKKEVWYARTYAESDSSLESVLLDAIENYNSDRCSEIRKRYGYQYTKTVPEIPKDGTQYPEIELGRLYGSRRKERVTEVISP